MPHPLNVKIGVLRRKARVLLVAHGASCVLAIALTAAVLAALGDFALHYEEPGIRWASTISVALVLAWTVWRYLLPALRFRLDDIFLARQIERRFPELRERLAGAVAFLHEPIDAPHSGSQELRRRVIHETTEDALRLPMTEIVQSRPVVLAVVAAAVVVAAMLALGAAHRESARIAAARLLKPWGDDAWPQTNKLKVVDPVARLAHGHRFRAEVVDEAGEGVDGEVTLLFRRQEPNAPIERLTMRPEAGSWSAERAKVTHDFSYRAIGGDDRSMPWIDVQVVEPPVVREIQWKIDYPAYTHWQPLDTGKRPGDQNVFTSAIPAGSVLEASARTNKPLRSAVLHLDGDQTLPAKVADDRLGFTLSAAGGNAWKVSKSQTYRWELVGDDGFTGGDDLRRELLIEADPPPWVKLPLPQATPEDPRGDIVVTPQATINVQVQAGDSFTVRPGIALREVVLRYNRSDRSAEGDVSLPLHAGPQTLAPPLAPAPQNLRDEETRTFDYAWDLKPLSLPPGAIVTLFAAASDYQPQERTSESRRLRIVSPDEFLERMNDRQRALHADLNRLRNKQAAAQQQTEAAGKQAAAKTAPDAQAADAQRRELADALDLQREVAAGLGVTRKAEKPAAQPSEKSEGIKGRVDSMLADMKANQIDNREVESRLADIAAELSAAEQEAKPHEIADRVAEALKADAQDAKQRQEAKSALEQAGEGQQKMLAALDAMLENLSQWDDYGKFHEQLAQVKREQEQIAAETSEQLRKQLTNEGKPGDTAEQRQAAAAEKREELAERQAAAARKFEQLQQDMRRNRDAGHASGAEALDRAVQAAEEANPAGAMRDAGQMLRDDQLGKAPEQQQEAIRRLGEVMQALSAQKLDELNRLVAKLKAAESELDRLAKEQRGLQKKFKDAQQIADPAERNKELQRLSRQQREAQKKTEQLAEQLKRLKAQRSASRTAKGSERQSGAGQAGEQGDSETAEDNAEAAARDLENAQRELAEERRQAEDDLAREAAAKLQDDLKAFIARQQHVVDEVGRYETLRQTGALTRAGQIGILDLAEEQAGLEQETRDSAVRLGSAAAFKLALEGAAAEMALTAQSLRERRTDVRTQRTAQNAVRRYQQLLDALKPRKPPGGQKGEGEGGGGQGGESGGGGSESPTSLAELVLIKLMQEDVHARTKELDASRKQGRLPPEESAELKRLSEEQGKLADLLLEIVGEEEAAETDAEKAATPDLELDDLDLDKPPRKPADRKPADKGPAEARATGDTE